MHEPIVQLMQKLRDLGQNNPLMLQFDLRDPETNEVLSIVTNLFLRALQTGKDADGNELIEDKLCLRNITIKAAHLYKH